MHKQGKTGLRSQSSGGSRRTTEPGTNPAAGMSLVERDLCAVNPLSQQFEPTPDSPIPQHKRMAGYP